jgi:hypothetical protein
MTLQAATLLLFKAACDRGRRLAQVVGHQFTGRASVAREHNLPAYVIFHDATLASIAERAPATLENLQGISGIGTKKLEAYGGMCCGCAAASGCIAHTSNRTPCASGSSREKLIVFVARRM